MTPKFDTSFRAGHRERLRAKLESNKLTSYEKLELLLTYAIPRRDVKPIAHALLNRFGGIYKILHADLDALETVPGVGHNTALLIHLVHELIHVSYLERLADGAVLQNQEVVEQYCRNMLIGKSVEEFHVLYLDHDYRLIQDDMHSRGTAHQSSAYPREIAKRAAVLNASFVILAHNHPMSANTFSTDDIVLTDKIKEELSNLDIKYFDHYLVCGNGVIHSMEREQWLRKSSFCD